MNVEYIFESPPRLANICPRKIMN